MIQKVDNLQKGDLIIVDGKYVGIYYNHSEENGVVISIRFYMIKWSRMDRINTRNSPIQRVYKITTDNLSPEELNDYYLALKLL